MNDIIKTYQERFRRNRDVFRRYTALLLALALITTLFVNWQLHGVGISMTADYQCGEIEHTHTADCYTRVLVCGYEEGELENPEDVAAADTDDLADPDTTEPEPQTEWVAHVHTDDCYTEVRTLTCMEEEHIHTDDCYDPEDGSLTCDKFEHTHDESCYTVERELTCGLQEGELVEQVVEPTESAALFEQATAQPVAVELPADTVEPIYHHHTDACYEEVLTCPYPEHHHTVECLSDTEADVETEEDWLEQTDTVLSGFWSEDLVNVAKSQLGYEQSEKNFQLDGDDQTTVRHYTRYGEAYGNPYGEWDVMFLSYCLRYAQIPQMAVPQEAGTLALRSAMHGMEWYWPEETGETAAPGDIVFYQKNASRAVVVEPEQPDFSWDDSGIALLPADETTARPVVTDETDPVIVQMPDTTSVETVGIVTDIDEETGELTVISGDVDGKVAEVQLAPDDVQGVVSVVSAQTALDGDGGAAVQPGTDGTTASVRYLDYFEETKDKQDGGITSIDITVDGQKLQPGSSVELKKGSKITLNYGVNITAGALEEEGTRTLTYQLPDGIYLSTAVDNVKIDDGVWMSVTKDGKVTLTFDDTYDISKPFSGHFELQAKVTTDGLDDSGKITFPGDSASITVKDESDLNISKSGTLDESVDGKTIIHYTVIVDSSKGWDEEIYIKDLLENSGATKGKYLWDSFEVVDKKGKKVNYTLTKNTDEAGFSITGLPAMEKGSKYTLTYDVELTDISKNTDGSYSFKNNVWTNTENKITSEVRHDNIGYKSGSYDPDTGLITWTVTVSNYYGGTIPKGYKITDLIQTNGLKIVGDVTITEKKQRYGSETYFGTITGVDGKTTFDYTFPGGCDGQEYKFTYKTTAPVASGQKVTNEFSDDGGHKVSGETWTSDRSWSLKKEAANSELTAVDGKDNLYKAYWKISTPVPNNWDTKKVISDIIQSPNKSDEGKHYGIAADLDAEIRKNLRFNCTDGTSLSYDQAVAAGIGIEIKYYSSRQEKYWNAATEIAASDTTKEVEAFQIELTNHYTGDKRIKELVIDSYYTYVDVTGVPNDKKVKYENKAGTTASYTYEKKTPETPSEIKKGVSKEKGDSIQQAEGRDKYGKTATISYNLNGKTYLYYQVLVDVSERKDKDGEFLDDTITVTDHLPAGLTYVDGSAEATYWQTNGSFWNMSYNTWGSQPSYEHNLDDSNYFGAVVTGDSSTGQTLNFNFYYLTRLKKHNDSDGATTGAANKKGFLIRYTVEVDTTSDDSVWRNPETDSYPYTNTVSWNGHSDDASATVNRQADVLDKSAEQSNGVSGADYTIKINPIGKDLAPGNTLTLTDTLTVEKGFAAVLDLDSVKLYDASDMDSPLPEGMYTFIPGHSVNSNGENVYTMTLTVPDERALVLKYTYKTNAGVGKKVKLKNEASLEGKWSVKKDKELSEVSVSGSFSQDKIVVHKVDSRNQKIALSGAKFRLYQFNSATGTWTSYHTQHMETDAKGTITFYIGTTGEYEIRENVLYRLTEEEPPDGYRKSDTDYYFIWQNEGQSEEDAYNAAVADRTVDADGVTLPTLGSKTLLMCQKGAQRDLYVPNDRSQLVIQKFWATKYNETLTPTETSVTVKLYKYAKNGTDGSRENGIFVKDIELTKDNNWTAKYNDLEPDYLYYIEEASTGRKYDVIYSDSNTEGVENGGLLTLTNRERSGSDYELPSTGGAGTLPFTIAGGTLMLTALVYGVRRKRRHEKGVGC